MNLASLTIRGYVEHKLDAKGRVSVPVGWRPGDGRPLYLMRSKSYGLPVLRVMTEDSIQQKIEEVHAAEDLNPGQKQKIVGVIFSNSQEANVNDQGKMSVPKAWAEAQGMGLPGEVVLRGRGNHFEMMSMETYQEIQRREESENEELLERFGI